MRKFSDIFARVLFSVTGLHPWPHTGGVPLDPFKIAYSIKYIRNAKALVFLRICEGWVEPSLLSNVCSYIPCIVSDSTAEAKTASVANCAEVLQIVNVMADTMIMFNYTATDLVLLSI